MKEKVKETTGWGVFAGCRFDCVYCEASYKRQLKRGLCPKCKAYEPHFHPERLNKLPSDSVIFVASSGDISFCDPADLDQILDVMRKDKKEGRVFLLQSKNPAYFANILDGLPQNVVLLISP